MTTTATEKVTKPIPRRWPRLASSIVAKIRTKAHRLVQIVHCQVNLLLSATPSLSRHSHLQLSSLEKRIASVLPGQRLRTERRQVASSKSSAEVLNSWRSRAKPLSMWAAVSFGSSSIAFSSFEPHFFFSFLFWFWGLCVWYFDWIRRYEKGFVGFKIFLGLGLILLFLIMFLIFFI